MVWGKEKAGRGVWGVMPLGSGANPSTEQLLCAYLSGSRLRVRAPRDCGHVSHIDLRGTSLTDQCGLCVLPVLSHLRQARLTSHLDHASPSQVSPPLVKDFLHTALIVYRREFFASV